MIYYINHKEDILNWMVNLKIFNYEYHDNKEKCLENFIKDK